MTTTNAVLVWHFAGAKLRDGRPLPIAGEVLRHEGEVVPCKSGLHGSVRAIDALRFAPGSLVARCELGGTVLPHGTDKLAASERRYLTGYVDATRVLNEFACWCATLAMDLCEARSGRKVDPRSRRAVEVKLLWLDGRATDTDLAAAGAAAWAAEGSTAGAAAWAAEGSTAGAAAWDAEGAAAWAAAGSTAGAAAWDAAWDAARDEQNSDLEHRLTELLEASNV